MTTTSNIVINVPVWQTSHAYTAGTNTLVTNSGNCYVCITSGTSASSGGPTTTSLNITDGTAHWMYLCAVNYTSLASWASGIAGTPTQPIIGQVLANGPILMPATGSPYLSLTGHSTTPTNTITLTAFPGYSIGAVLASNIATVATGFSSGFSVGFGSGQPQFPLALSLSSAICFVAPTTGATGFSSGFSSGFGAALSPNINYFDITDPNVIIDGLQFQDTVSNDTCSLLRTETTASNFVLRNCIFDAYAQNLGASILDINATYDIYNNLIVDRQAAASTAQPIGHNIGNGSHLVNNTIIKYNGDSSTTIAVNWVATTGAVFRNNAIFGYNVAFAGTGGNASADHNVVSASTLVSTGLTVGSGNLTGKLAANQFVNSTSDWRIVKTADCVRAGIADPTDVPSSTDIAGHLRVEWDAGAWALYIAALTATPIINLIATGIAAQSTNHANGTASLLVRSTVIAVSQSDNASAVINVNMAVVSAVVLQNQAGTVSPGFSTGFSAGFGQFDGIVISCRAAALVNIQASVAVAIETISALGFLNNAAGAVVIIPAVVCVAGATAIGSTNIIGLGSVNIAAVASMSSLTNASGTSNADIGSLIRAGQEEQASATVSLGTMLAAGIAAQFDIISAVVASLPAIVCVGAIGISCSLRVRLLAMADTATMTQTGQATGRAAIPSLTVPTPVQPKLQAQSSVFGNSSLAGAVAGTPGTLWTGADATSQANGLAFQVVNTGTDGTTGNTFVDLRMQGTGNGTDCNIYLSGLNGTATLPSITYTYSVGLAVVAGSTANLAGISITSNDLDAGEGFIQGAAFSVLTLTGTVQTFTTSFTTTASTAFNTIGIDLGNPTSGQPVDITLRIENPQVIGGIFLLADSSGLILQADVSGPLNLTESTNISSTSTIPLLACVSLASGSNGTSGTFSIMSVVAVASAGQSDVASTNSSGFSTGYSSGFGSPPSTNVLSLNAVASSLLQAVASAAVNLPSLRATAAAMVNIRGSAVVSLETLTAKAFLNNAAFGVASINPACVALLNQLYASGSAYCLANIEVLASTGVMTSATTASGTANINLASVVSLASSTNASIAVNLPPLAAVITATLQDNVSSALNINLAATGVAMVNIQGAAAVSLDVLSCLGFLNDVAAGRASINLACVGLLTQNYPAGISFCIANIGLLTATASMASATAATAADNIDFASVVALGQVASASGLAAVVLGVSSVAVQQRGMNTLATLDSLQAVVAAGQSDVATATGTLPSMVAIGAAAQFDQASSATNIDMAVVANGGPTWIASGTVSLPPLAAVVTLSSGTGAVATGRINLTVVSALTSSTNASAADTFATMAVTASAMLTTPANTAISLPALVAVAALGQSDGASGRVAVVLAGGGVLNNASVNASTLATVPPLVAAGTALNFILSASASASIRLSVAAAASINGAQMAGSGTITISAVSATGHANLAATLASLAVLAETNATLYVSPIAYEPGADIIYWNA